MVGDKAEKYMAMVWIPPFCHIMIKSFGQMFATDGTHNMSKHGWRAIPLCVCNSLGNPHPVAMAWATAECLPVMNLIASHITQHCLLNNYEQHPFGSIHLRSNVDPGDAFLQPDWVDNLDEVFVCAPMYRAFVRSIMDGCADMELLPEVDNRPGFMSDGGLAFRAFGSEYNLRHGLCKQHLDAHNHVGSTNEMYVRVMNNIIMISYQLARISVRCTPMVMNIQRLLCLLIVFLGSINIEHTCFAMYIDAFLCIVYPLFSVVRLQKWQRISYGKKCPLQSNTNTLLNV
jgi:hypothetical protein